MANRKRVIAIYEKALRKPASLKFREARALAEGVGFRLDRIRGSHHIFVHHSQSNCLINLQEVRGDAKPYQVRQLLKLIEEFQLLPQ